MPEIMRKAKCLGQILIKSECACNRPANLRNFDTVGQADTEMITIGRNENLCFMAQPAKAD